MTILSRSFMALVMLVSALTMSAQSYSSKKVAKLEKKLNRYFMRYAMQQQQPGNTPVMLSYKLDDAHKRLTITASDAFAQQSFSKKKVEDIYHDLAKAVPSPFDEYKITVITGGTAIERLVSNQLPGQQKAGLGWGSIQYSGRPWVANVSRPNNITHGLQGCHLSLWASHGRYYDSRTGSWKWQRPSLFCTTEDLYTQTIVIPYLIPMLQNAGAIVFTPRERDWQKHEYVIDNDTHASPYYIELQGKEAWRTTAQAGFASHPGSYTDGENPFTSGTARMAKTTTKAAVSTISWQPNFTEEGRHAVYVSYQTQKKSVDDAQYLVYHKGQVTEFRVNQRMGDGTWVYLGTFNFDKGCNKFNRVVLTNASHTKGVVTADAVRFGGGMGNIARGGSVSGLPRCLEGARYYAQWAGAPDSVVTHSNGSNDYNDDINARSLMANWLSGGSCYLPDQQGKHVPIELSLAVHSDAGTAPQGTVGTLTICTTTGNSGADRFDNGASRAMSRQLADDVLDGVCKDLGAKYGSWTRRGVWDRNYSETRRPEVPATIIETLSHQNFADMRYGQDPNFKFTLARAIYKAVARFVCKAHDKDCIIEPLAPNHFTATLAAPGKVRLSWQPVADPLEPTARATSYNVYVAIGNGDFNNATQVQGRECEVDVKPGITYSFKITACNRGGESFPTEVLSVVWQPGARQTVLVVNGFHRLSSPAVINTDSLQGFDLNADPGLTLGPTAGWCGTQQCFNVSQAGKEGPGALGYSGQELVGTFVAGNNFNYVKEHADALRTAKAYNVVSCSADALESGSVRMADYSCTDLLLGQECFDGHSLVYYKTFTPTMRRLVADYVGRGGRILVSGSFVGSDMTAPEERQFLGQTFHLSCPGKLAVGTGEGITGLGLNFDVWRNINEHHYATTSPDVLQPVQNAFTAMRYASGQSAAVAYNGRSGRTFVMGFPLECIKDAAARATVMRGLMAFLLNGQHD